MRGRSLGRSRDRGPSTLPYVQIELTISFSIDDDDDDDEKVQVAEELIEGEALMFRGPFGRRMAIVDDLHS